MVTCGIGRAAESRHCWCRWGRKKLREFAAGKGECLPPEGGHARRW